MEKSDVPAKSWWGASIQARRVPQIVRTQVWLLRARLVVAGRGCQTLWAGATGHLQGCCTVQMFVLLFIPYYSPLYDIGSDYGG